jgi:hypothetical protein
MIGIYLLLLLIFIYFTNRKWKTLVYIFKGIARIQNQIRKVYSTPLLYRLIIITHDLIICIL